MGLTLFVSIICGMDETPDEVHGEPPEEDELEEEPETELTVGVAVGAAVGVGEAVGVGVGEVQVGLVMVLVSNVTAPFRANIRPSTVTLVVTVMLVKAMRVPRKVELVPKVASLPICQKTLQD